MPLLLKPEKNRVPNLIFFNTLICQFEYYADLVFCIDWYFFFIGRITFRRVTFRELLFKVNLAVPLNSFKQEELKEKKKKKKNSHLLYSINIMENVIWMIIIRYMPHMGLNPGAQLLFTSCLCAATLIVPFRPHFSPKGFMNGSLSPRTLFSVQFSRSVVSNSLWPHELQHARPPCPSPTPRVYPNSCPVSWGCHPTISSSVIPFSSQHQGLFQWISSLHQVAKVLEFQLQHQSFQWTPRTDLL